MLALLTCSACREKTAAKTHVIVFAAASLGEAFRAAEHVYEQHNPDIDIVINFAGSQVLAAQLLEGAPADVFAAADDHTLDRVLAQRPGVPDSRTTFTSNQLVIVVPEDSPVRSFDDVDDLLVDPQTKAVLAEPEAPIGRYSRQALDQLGLRDAFEARLRSNEDSVDGVLAKVDLGEADIGLAYATDLRRGRNLRGISPPVVVAVRYEIAALADGPSPHEGQAFVNWLTAPAGQELLRDYGFGEP